MANEQAGLPSSIGSDLLPPHLRRKKREYANKPATVTEIIKIYEGMKEDIIALRGELAQMQLAANTYLQFKTNETEFAISEYELLNIELSSTEWHNVRYSTSNLLGDRGTYNSNTAEFKYRAGIPGRYKINASLDFYFIEVGAATKEEIVEIYTPAFLLAFTDEDYQLGIYDETNSVLLKVIDVFPVRASNYTNGDFYYHTAIGLNGSDIIYLDAGQEISIKVNLMLFGEVGAVKIKFKYGQFNCHYVSDLENLI